MRTIGSGSLIQVYKKEIIMRTEHGNMTDSKVNGSSKLSVYVSEKREGFFVIQPIGSINTITSPILQNEVEQICESKPEIIMFNMKQVSYINSKGLHILLKVHQAMKLRGGRIVLTNLQPHIKEVFDIIDLFTGAADLCEPA